MVGVDRRGRATRPHGDGGTDVIGVAAGGRACAAELADEHGRGRRRRARPRAARRGARRRRRRGGSPRAGRPRAARRAGRRDTDRWLLGVGDAAAGGHEVELAGPDHLLGAEAVVVEHLPGEQPRHRLQADVRVRADVDSLLLGDRRGTHVVDEAPRPDGAAGRRGSARRTVSEPTTASWLSVTSTQAGTGSASAGSASASSVVTGPLMGRVCPSPPGFRRTRTRSSIGS